MDLHTFAASETSSLIDRLLARQSTSSSQQLQAIREALEAAFTTLANPPDVRTEVHEAVGRVAAAAEAEVRVAREQAQATVDHVNAEIASCVAEIERLRAVIVQAEAETALLRSELQTSHERAQAADRDLEATIEAHTTLEAELRALEGELKQLKQAKGTLESQLAEARSAIELMMAEGEEFRAQADRDATERAALLRELSRLQEQGDKLASDLSAATGRVQTLEHEAAAARHAHQELAGQLEGAHAHGRALESDLGATREQRDALTKQLDASHARITAIEGELAQAHQQRADAAKHLEVSAARVATIEKDLKQAAAQAREAREQRDVMAVKLEASHARVNTLETELAQTVVQAREARDQRDSLTGEVENNHSRVGALEAELAQMAAQARDAREQRESLTVQLETSQTRVRTLETELESADEARQQRDAMTTELVASTERIGALETQQAEQAQHIRELQALLDEAARKEMKVREEAVKQARSSGSGDAEAVDAMRAEVERMVSLFDASARAVTEMAAATDSSTLLSEMVKRLSLQFTRVALFRLKGNRLEGEHQIGFDDGADMSKLVIPTSIDSILTRALTSGTVQSLAGKDVAVQSGTPFGGAPTSAVALPIVLQGTTLAVVYADDNDMPDSARGPAVHESSVGFARLLVGQVVVLLVRHTHELKTLAELSQYATTLLQEAKEMYLADAQAGKSTDMLRSRLKDNIECACQLYAYRAAMEGTAAAALLDEQIAAEIDSGTAFAKDLARVVKQMASSDVGLAAEAS
jgi:chromosome segregation ATPase